MAIVAYGTICEHLNMAYIFEETRKGLFQRKHKEIRERNKYGVQHTNELRFSGYFSGISERKIIKFLHLCSY